MKVYVYFLKTDPKDLYAYTTSKEYAKKFEEERDMKLFIKGKIKMTEEERKKFEYSNQKKRMIRDAVSDNGVDIEIISTVSESAQLSESMDYFSMTFENLDDYLAELVTYDLLKDKYADSLDKLILSVIDDDEDGSPQLRCNSFRLFMYLFGNTYYKKESSDEVLFMKRD